MNSFLFCIMHWLKCATIDLLNMSNGMFLIKLYNKDNGKLFKNIKN